MRKKRENGMAKESGMGDFPRKQFESVLLHSLRCKNQEEKTDMESSEVTPKEIVDRG